MVYTTHGWIFTLLLYLWLPLIICAKGLCKPPEGQTFRTLPPVVQQKVFHIEKFHYLHAPSIGTLAVQDVFDCTFGCLHNPLCSSVNLATSERADGTFWCELLSSDGYRNPKGYSGNQSSHHFNLDSPCSSYPCHNRSACEANHRDNTFQCICESGFTGEYCEKALNSCKDIYDVHKLNVSKLVPLIISEKPVSILCQMGDFGCGDGGWTPVMKIDGSKDTFHFRNSYWTDKNEYNPSGGETGFDQQQTKLPTYWNTSFSKICLGMMFEQQLRFMVINKKADSLYSLIADGKHRSTSLGRNTWKKLLGHHASLQLECNKEGFNSRCGDEIASARIGIVTNNEAKCDSCDSRFGFGTEGVVDDDNTCGNVAVYQTDNGDKHIKAMGYILVQ